jgi:hypothetical protein
VKRRGLPELGSLVLGSLMASVIVPWFVPTGMLLEELLFLATKPYGNRYSPDCSSAEELAAVSRLLNSDSCKYCTSAMPSLTTKGFKLLGILTG